MSDHGILTRRQAMATMGAAAGALLSSRRIEAAAAGYRFELARGTVFEDRRGTGCRTSGDPGIGGVMVSNGRDVVTTDTDGRWCLPVQSGDSIFVITPSQWAAPAQGPATFSYLHQPEGTPGAQHLRYSGIEPTGDLPSSIDFPLTRQAQSQSFEVLLFADTQAADSRELGFARQMLMDATRGSNAAFAIHHGDAMGDDLTLFPEYRRILGETGIAWHHCPGNHDMNLDAADPRFAFESWKRFIGPTSYAFQHGEVTFILLNNVDYFGREGQVAGGRGYRGRFGEDQLRFVANVLRNIPADQLVVVSMHIPLQSFDDPDSMSDTTIDRGGLLKLLSARPHSVSFSGHSHTTEHHYLGHRDGFSRDAPHHHHVLTAACGSWWSGPPDARGVPVADSRDGSPKGFHVLSVAGNRYTTRFVSLGPAGDPDMRILVRDSATKSSTLLVDVFDGGPRTRVTCEIDGEPSPVIELARANLADPYVIEYFARNRTLCKPWVAAAPSSHMWMAALPPSMGSQTSALVVRVTGEYGQTLVRYVCCYSLNHWC